MADLLRCDGIKMSEEYDIKKVLNESLNTNQKILKGDLTSLVILQEIIKVLDTITKKEGEDKAVSNHIIKHLQLRLDTLPEIGVSHDPSIVGAYDAAVNIVKSTQKTKI